MLGKCKSCAVVGLDGVVVEVEVDVSPGLSAFNIVGLPDEAVQEARERVRPAVRNSGFRFPSTRIAVNLAPADLKKEGPSYDLPIAVGLVLATDEAAFDTEGCVFLGELSLDGTVRPITGVLAMVAAARQEGLRTVYLPAANAREAALVSGVTIIPVSSLTQLVAHLTGRIKLPEYVPPPKPAAHEPLMPSVDISDVKGQEHAKRALEVAAAGAHNLLMSGPPGSGKTLLARALPTILSAMTEDEALEVTRIYSVSGLLPHESPLMTQRPFRAPHYTISHAGLVGGGHIPHPGEVTLSHRGVLFLDELPEFTHISLESLRQPLEDKVVTISRARGTMTFPSNFMLVAAMNPCPCCRCT